MDAELQAMADALDRIDGRLLVIDQAIPPAPPPRRGTVVYMSGRWKMRDGTMHGR